MDCHIHGLINDVQAYYVMQALWLEKLGSASYFSYAYGGEGLQFSLSWRTSSYNPAIADIVSADAYCMAVHHLQATFISSLFNQRRRELLYLAWSLWHSLVEVCLPGNLQAFLSSIRLHREKIVISFKFSATSSCLLTLLIFLPHEHSAGRVYGKDRVVNIVDVEPEDCSTLIFISRSFCLSTPQGPGQNQQYE